MYDEPQGFEAHDPSGHMLPWIPDEAELAASRRIGTVVIAVFFGAVLGHMATLVINDLPTKIVEVVCK